MNPFRKGLHRLTWTLSFLADYQPESIGGQAVIEGVLMRSPRRLAVAVRAPDGSIVVDNREFLSYSRRHKILSWPILRGAASLVESLAIGIKALNFSMAVQERPSAQERAPKPDHLPEAAHMSVPPAPPAAEAKRTRGENLMVAGSLLTSLALALGLFQLLPYFVAGQLTGGTQQSPADPVLFNLTAGAIRMGLLLAYMWGISFLKDIGRVFQYHGAEHKSIFVHERRSPLDVASARLQSRFHPRCGTSFILIVALVCIGFFSAFDALLLQAFQYSYPSPLVRFLLHLPLVPLVAGIAFEVLKLTARFQDSPWVKPLVAPGLWLQKITTKEPDEKQLEVAIASIRAALI
jgi:uncharacterized protein YqhQ